MDDAELTAEAIRIVQMLALDHITDSPLLQANLQAALTAMIADTSLLLAAVSVGAVLSAQLALQATTLASINQNREVDRAARIAWAAEVVRETLESVKITRIGPTDLN